MPSTSPIRTIGARLALALPVVLMLAAGSGRSTLAQDAGSTPDNGNLGLRGNGAADAFRADPSPAPTLGSPAGTSTIQPTAEGATPNEGPAPDQSGVAVGSGQPNYGRPRKVVKQYGPRKTAVAHPLPVVQRYPTAPGVRENARRGVPIVDLPAPPPPTVAVIPGAELLRRRVVDDAPFAPLGFDIGSLRLKPYIESDFGYDTNPQQANTGVVASPYSRLEGGGTFQSNWSNHELTGDLRAGYSDYFSNHAADRPDATGKVDGRIDVTRDTKINLEGRFALTTQSSSSPELANAGGSSVIGRPFIMQYGGTLGATQQIGRLALTLGATVDRTAYGDAKLAGGGIDPLSEEDYTAYGLRARAAYELKPGLVPFIEAFGDTRVHDQSVDLSGFARNSVGAGALAGTSFEVSPKLAGQVSAGYEDRAYKDPRLADLRGPLVDASVVWSATPLTTVTFLASSSFDETDIPNASGSISQRASLEVSHALLRNLTITGLLSYQNTAYTGIDLNENTYDVGAKIEYSLTRSLVVRGSFTHERLQSATSGLDYTQNVFLLGLRLQE